MQHRLRLSAAVFAAAACLVGLVGFAPKADAWTLVAPNAFTKVLEQKKADDNSLNWGGYYVPVRAGDHVTEVFGTMMTPKPQLLPPTLAASWVGIGGATTTDLIQAGVAFGRFNSPTAPTRCLNNCFFAWYEMLPDPMIPIHSGCIGDSSCKVTFGDRIDTRIRYLGNDGWNIAITNVGKWTWSMETKYRSTFSSAEWIYEAPSYFGVVTVPGKIDHAYFHNPDYIMNGVRRPLVQSQAVRTHVSPIGILNISTTSNVNSRGSFAVCPYQQSCATPG